MVFVVMESSVRQWPVVSGQWSVNGSVGTRGSGSSTRGTEKIWRRIC